MPLIDPVEQAQPALDRLGRDPHVPAELGMVHLLSAQSGAYPQGSYELPAVSNVLPGTDASENTGFCI